MKKLVFFLFFLFFPLFVSASDLKLNHLVIENGELSLPFDPLNTSYTISLEKDIDKINFVYEVDNDIEVTIENNQDLQNNSVVVLSLTNKEDTIFYTFHILKEEEESTNTVFLEEKEEENTNFMMQYKNSIIPISCFILILISYKILFFHKK